LNRQLKESGVLPPPITPTGRPGNDSLPAATQSTVATPDKELDKTKTAGHQEGGGSRPTTSDSNTKGAAGKTASNSGGRPESNGISPGDGEQHDSGISVMSDIDEYDSHEMLDSHYAIRDDHFDIFQETYEGMLRRDFHTLGADAFEQHHPMPRHYVPWKSYFQYWVEKKAEVDGWLTHLLDNGDAITQAPATPSQFTEVDLDNLLRMVLTRCNAAKRTYRTFMNMPPEQIDSTRTAHVTRMFSDIRRAKHDIDIEVAAQRTFLRHRLTSAEDVSEKGSIGSSVLPQGGSEKRIHVLDERVLRDTFGATSENSTKAKHLTISAQTYELRLKLDDSDNRMRTLQRPALDTTGRVEAIIKPKGSNKTIVDGRLSPTSRLRTSSEPAVGEELSLGSDISASTYPYSGGLAQKSVTHSTEKAIVCLRDTSTGHTPVPTTPSVASAEGQVTFDRDLPGTEAGSQHTGGVSDNAYSHWDNTGDLNTPPRQELNLTGNSSVLLSEDSECSSTCSGVQRTSESPTPAADTNKADQDPPPETCPGSHRPSRTPHKKGPPLITTAEDPFEDIATQDDLEQDLTVRERALLAETKRLGNRSGYLNGGVVMEIQAHLGQIP
jgi:hypothetical protein